jgi:NADPH:quinone reductase-like Zn-dependent oxidoreductase
MKAAIIEGPGKTPVYGEFAEPVAQDGMEIVTVSASALSNLTKGRASGTHYSSDEVYPAVPGVDGVGRTQDGRRVYFALPEAPFGAMAERSLVRSERCVPIPDGLDDITAAAIANPGMSAWASLVVRAHLQAGETVLVNGATGSAGRVAVQLAKYLGAGKVIATGRNAVELEGLKELGADVAIPFAFGDSNPDGAKEFEETLKWHFADGIDVVIDYLWGESAKTIITAVVKAVEDARPVRFVQVGTAGGEENIELSGSALRSSAIVLMGSGLKSVRMSVLLESIASVFAAAGPARLKIATRAVPLSEVESVWQNAAGNPRVVFTIG